MREKSQNPEEDRQQAEAGETKRSDGVESGPLSLYQKMLNSLMLIGMSEDKASEVVNGHGRRIEALHFAIAPNEKSPENCNFSYAKILPLVLTFVLKDDRANITSQLVNRIEELSTEDIWNRIFEYILIVKKEEEAPLFYLVINALNEDDKSSLMKYREEIVSIVDDLPFLKDKERTIGYYNIKNNKDDENFDDKDILLKLIEELKMKIAKVTMNLRARCKDGPQVIKNFPASTLELFSHAPTSVKKADDSNLSR